MIDLVVAFSSVVACTGFVLLHLRRVRKLEDRVAVLEESTHVFKIVRESGGTIHKKKPADIVRLFGGKSPQGKA